MAYLMKLPYQRLSRESSLDFENEKDQKIWLKSRSCWYGRFRKVPIRRRLKLKIPRLRRKIKWVSTVRYSVGNIVNRLRESQSHLGDLFAGNYLFLQVNPSSVKGLKKRHDLHGLPSTYSLPSIA